MRNQLPSSAEHLLGTDGQLNEAWAKTGSGYAFLKRTDGGASIVGAEYEATITEVLQKEGWEPADIYVDGDADQQGWPDKWHVAWSRMWRYWVTTPSSAIEGVRQFVAAAESGGLPQDWTEQAATDGSTDYTLCSYTLTMDGARSLGSSQRALVSDLTGLNDLPDAVDFFQRVADIEGFSGIERVSRQPTEIDSQIYTPTELYQTSHPDAGDARGTTWTESDVLDTTGLTLL